MLVTMPKNTIWYLSLAAGISLVTLIIMAQGYVEAAELDGLQFMRTEINFEQACTYYRILNNKLSDMDASELKSVDLGMTPELTQKGYSDGMIKVVGDVMNPRWEFLVPDIAYDCSLIDWAPKTVCTPFTSKNGTKDSTCVTTGTYSTIPRTCYADRWVGKSDSKADALWLEPARSMEVRFCADIVREPVADGWGISVDHIPTFSGRVYDKYAWWNSTYDYRYSIANNASANTSIVFSVNDSSGINGDILWTRTNNVSYVYSVDAGTKGDIAIGNETDSKNWYWEKNLTGNVSENFWTDESAEMVIHFGEATGTTAADATANNRDMQCSGGSWYATAPFGYGYDFSSDNCINTTETTGMYDDTSYTVMIWFNSDVTGAERMIFTHGVATYTYYCRWDAGNTITCAMGVDNGIPWCTTGGVSASTWYHLALVKDGTTTMTIYLNGAVGCVDSDFGNGGTLHPNAGLFFAEDGAGNHYFEGKLDDFRYYNGALTQEQVQMIYWNGINNMTRLGPEEADVPVPGNNGPEYSNNRTKYPSETAFGHGKTYGFEIQFDVDSGYFNTSNVSFVGNFSGVDQRWEYDNATSYVRNDSANVFYINFTQDQINGTTKLYKYYWTATNGTANTTAHKDYNMTKGLPACSITPSTQAITYGGSILQLCSCNSTKYRACSLWRDSTNDTVHNNTNVTLGAGTYNYKSNVTGDDNCSAAQSSTSVVTVKKAGILNVVKPDTETITYGTTRTQYCTDNSTAYECTLWRNDVNVTDANNTAPTLPAGTHDYVANTSAPAANYTQVVDSETLTINKATSAVNLLINGTDGNKNIANTSAINLTCSITAGDTGGDVEIYTNLTGWATQIGASPLENSSHVVQETEGNSYNATCYYNATQNYTGASETHWITISQTYLIDEDIYPTVLFEGETGTFIINLTNTSDKVTDMDATFKFNDTYYTATKTTGAGWYRFIATAVAPNNTGDFEAKASQWNFTVYEGASSTSGTSTARSINVYTPKIVLCNSSLTVSKRMWFRNESADFEILNGSAYTKVEFTQFNYIYYSNWTWTNTSKEICIYPAWGNYSVDGHIHYVGDNDTFEKYHWRDYWLDNIMYTNATENMDLYLLIDEYPGTAYDSLYDPIVTVIVQDQYSSAYANLTVEVLRAYDELYTYKKVAVLRTDDQGRASTYLSKHDQWYAFKVYNDGVLLKSVTEKLVTESDNTITITIDPGELIEQLKYYIKGNCWYDETETYLKCNYNGPSAYMNGVSLDVYHIGSLIRSHICSITNMTEPAGTIVCDTGNITGKMYSYHLYANVTGGEGTVWDKYMIAQGVLNQGYEETKLFGTCNSTYNLASCREGIIIVFFLTLVSMLVAVYHPTTSIAFMLTTIGISWGIGLFAISMQALIGLMFVGAAIIYRTSRG